MANETIFQIGDKVFINDVLGEKWEPYFGLTMTVVEFSHWGSSLVYTTFDDENAFKKAQKESGLTPSPGRKSGEYAFSKCYINLCPKVVFDLSEMV